MFLIVLGVLSGVAYLFFARSAHELLQPLMDLPEGQATYAATMRRVAITIALFDLPLIVVVGIAAYVLARFSIRPLELARQREERFAADAAHELRSPLATIAALAQVAQRSDESARSHALERIAAVTLEASALLSDLLALMRESPDERRLHEPVDVAALAMTLGAELREQAGSIAIALTVPPDGAYVSGDVRALRQLIANLAANALRHARNRVTLTVRVQPRVIVLCVEDDGDGVAPADRERIFERFFKAQPGTAGSGLGLAICRHIALRHGGTVQLEDRARFVVRLPREPA